MMYGVYDPNALPPVMTDRKFCGWKVINPDNRIFSIDKRKEEFMSGIETCSKASGQKDHESWGRRAKWIWCHAIF